MNQSKILFLGICFCAVASLSLYAEVIDLSSDTAWTLSIDGGEKRAIKVPGGGWNSELQQPRIDRGRDVKDHVTYERKITIPKAKPDQVSKIQFGAVNYGAEVYINDTLAGEHHGPMMPFEVDITSHVEPGKSYTLKVVAYHRAHYEVVEPNDIKLGCIVPIGFDYQQGVEPVYPVYHSKFSYGITGYVKLAVLPSVYIEKAFVKPSVSKDQLGATVWVANHTDKKQKVKLRSALTSWNEKEWNYPELPDTTVTIPANSTRKVEFDTVTWGLGADSYWWPNIPFKEDYKAQLHYLDITMVQKNRVLHTLRQRFGFVEHLEGEYYYTINGIRVDMSSDGTCESQMVHDAYSRLPGFLPSVKCGPNASGGCPETWRKFMRIGIRGNRICQSTATRYMLDAADETGFLIIPETGIRGNHNQAWHDEYMPQAVVEMIEHARNHPCVARYSLSNETLFYKREAGYGWTNDHHRILIDRAVETDSTRPLMIETSIGYNHVNSTINGKELNIHNPNQHRRLDSKTGHAYLTHHYGDHPRPARTIFQMGEVTWTTNGIEPFSVKARDLRLNDICYYAPWSWLNYWPNFIDGSNHANYGYITNNHPDRQDDFDGWGSPQVEFCQKSLHPYLVMDRGLERLNISFTPNWPKNTDSYKPGETVSRNMEVFNSGLTGEKMQLKWSAHWDESDGEVIASGTSGEFTVKPGFHTTRTVEFQMPKDGDSTLRQFYLVVESFLEGKSVFKETYLRYECDSFTGKSTVEFIGFDTETQGNYKERYGSNGYEIITKESHLPGNISLNWIRPGGIWTWADQTKDVRALPYFMNAHEGEVRVAACHYGSTIEFKINTGKTPQQLALYFLDWVKQGEHAVEVEITAGDTVKKEVAENFRDGVYQIWKIQGRVNVKLKTREKDAVISGIFFD